MASCRVSPLRPAHARVEQQAKTGRYSNASDYVRDLIRRDQDRAAKIAAMQQLVTEGLESGIAGQSMAEIRDQGRALAGTASRKPGRAP